MKQPSLKEFRASCKSMFWKDCAELLRIDEKYTDAPRAMVYMNSVYIEDYIRNKHDHKHGHKGRYVLVVDRDVYYSDNKETLERILYKHMMQHEDGF